MHIHTKLTTQLQRIVEAEKSRGLMGSYGRWQSVLHAQTNGVWQLPLRKTCGCFLFFPLFSFFLLLPDWLLLHFTKHPLFTSVLFSLTSDDKPSVESHFLFILSFFSSFLSSPLFPSFLLAPFLFKPFCHHDKWILKRHGVGLSPMEVHSFIIKSGKARYELGGNNHVTGNNIFPWHSQLILVCV